MAEKKTRFGSEQTSGLRLESPTHGEKGERGRVGCFVSRFPSAPVERQPWDDTSRKCARAHNYRLPHSFIIVWRALNLRRWTKHAYEDTTRGSGDPPGLEECRR